MAFIVSPVKPRVALGLGVTFSDISVVLVFVLTVGTEQTRTEKTQPPWEA
jgi:hypothetical protein